MKPKIILICIAILIGCKKESSTPAPAPAPKVLIPSNIYGTYSGDGTCGTQHYLPTLNIIANNSSSVKFIWNNNDTLIVNVDEHSLVQQSDTNIVVPNYYTCIHNGSGTFNYPNINFSTITSCTGIPPWTSGISSCNYIFIHQ